MCCVLLVQFSDCGCSKYQAVDESLTLGFSTYFMTYMHKSNSVYLYSIYLHCSASHWHTCTFTYICLLYRERLPIWIEAPEVKGEQRCLGMTYSRVRHLLLIELNTLLLNCQHVLRGSMQTRYICLYINRQPYNLKSFTRLPTRGVLSLKIEDPKCVWHTALLRQYTCIWFIDFIPFYFIPFQCISSIREQNTRPPHVIWRSTGWYLVEMFRQRSDFEGTLQSNSCTTSLQHCALFYLMTLDMTILLYSKMSCI